MKRGRELQKHRWRHKLDSVDRPHPHQKKLGWKKTMEAPNHDFIYAKFQLSLVPINAPQLRLSAREARVRKIRCLLDPP
ncbi:MAG: hypothetical protein ACK4GQ_02140, partial [Candidatus Hadarchaeales archaeon]